MASQVTHSGRQELEQATKGQTAGNYDYRTSYRGCKTLICQENKDDYTWGFRIYRTTYSSTSDLDFDKAMKVFREYMRYECFMDVEDAMDLEGLTADEIDDKPNQQLLKRLKNEIVESATLLESAPASKLQEVHQYWIHSRVSGAQRGPRCQIFIIVDQEVVQKLLEHPMPATEPPDIDYAVKVFDVEVDDEEKVRYEPPHEGWFWIGATNLMRHWFNDFELDQEETFIRDEHNRPIHLFSHIDAT